MRSHGQDEEQDLQTKLNSFKNEVSDLRRISKEIEAYEMSDGPRELERFSDTLKKIEKRIEDRKRDLLNIEPSLEQVRKAVDDQERHKKHLKENIEILQAGDRIEELEKQIEKLQAKRKSIDNSEEVESEFQSVAAEIERLKEQKAQREGQFSTHGEQIRALKVRLSHECDPLAISLFFCSPFSANLSRKSTEMSTNNIVSRESRRRPQKWLQPT